MTKPTSGQHLRTRLMNAQPRAKTIKLADIISNLSTVEARDPAFAARYMVQKRRQLEWLAAGDAGLFERASRIVADYFTRHPEQLE